LQQVAASPAHHAGKRFLTELHPQSKGSAVYESKDHPLLPIAAFYWRLVRHFAYTLGVVALSLVIGSVGYHHFGGLDWIDAILNASMILTGMGPVDRMCTPAGKLFATAYALYSGVAFLSIVALLMAPLVHRFLHKFHLDDE
jgi:hypothetical protein